MWGKTKVVLPFPRLPVNLEPGQHSFEASRIDRAMAETPPATLSRRNLPRASHACQRCRVKKAKCDQQQPCSNCTKHAQTCTYELRRRNIREKTLHNTRSAPAGLSSPPSSSWNGQDHVNQRRELEKTPLSDHLCMYFKDSLGRGGLAEALLTISPSRRQCRRSR